MDKVYELIQAACEDVFSSVVEVVFVIISSMSHFSMGSTLTWPSAALSDLALNNITLVGTELVLTPAQIDMTGNHTVFHLEKLKDLTCAHEYAVAVSNRFDVLGALGDPVELWDTFKRETLQAVKECIGERPRSRRGFVSTETLEKI
ncbi:hypothetical protein GWK47_035398 [Chionoecetes opilio]|uniref:Uncharacterized protein n=1 Tax=Chionoecetes opilio TaxID=41210 RepID=A0A8J4YGY4_CHIOP|nr:hypothetical protein GWK47_035398 [Chionoecetes opilio]